MSVITLNTLKYSKKLIHAGVPRQQAEAQAEALAEIASEQLATKQDLKELEANVDIKLHKLENRLMTKVGIMIASSTALTITVTGIIISMHP